MDNYQKKLVIIASIIVIFTISLTFIFFNDHTQMEDRSLTSNSEDLKTQTFFKESYDPIIETDKLSYGNITVMDLDFDEAGITNDTENYSILDDDFNSGALIVNYDNTEFIETVNLAQIDNLDEGIEDSFTITVLLNDTISVEYNNSLAPLNGFLIYGSRLTPCTLTKLLLLDTGGSFVEEISDDYYRIDDNDYLIFDYYDYFSEDYKQFELYLIWEYEILIDEWILEQSNEALFITNNEQQINPLFEYNFTVMRNKIANNISEGIVEATNLDLYLRLSPADKEDLFGHSLKVGESFVSNYLNSDNSLNITIVSNLNQVFLNYTANFTIKFLDPIESSWAIDRLVSLRDIRERIYFPSLIEAPKHHILSNLYIYEKTITIDQVISNISLFERNVLVFDINVSLLEEDLSNSLIITRNIIKKKGLKIFVPFLIRGECNPFTIKYNANNDLKVIIADNIYMPLSGITVEFYYYGKIYGTYISNDKVQPISPIISDENGEVILSGVPNGNYTLKLYRGSQLLMETTINTFTSVNYIATNIVHFPLWIMIFGLINGILLLLGFIAYYKYKNR
jgi:hypothetical protein